MCVCVVCVCVLYYIHTHARARARAHTHTHTHTHIHTPDVICGQLRLNQEALRKHRRERDLANLGSRKRLQVLSLLAARAHKYKYWHRKYAAAELYRGGLPEGEDSHS